MIPDAVKSLLKKTFPRLFLKRAFGIYNRVRIATVDKLLFREYKIEPADFRLLRTGFPFRENNITIDDIRDTAVRKYMSQWYDWTQEEFILELNEQCVIEPDHGWAVAGTNQLVYYSLGISRTSFLPKPDWGKFRRRQNVVDVPACISLRDSGEENYFHFYNDVLAKIFFLQNAGIAIHDIPFVISRKLWEKPYFKYYFQRSELLPALTWIVQDQQYIRSAKTIFCKPLTHRRDLLDGLLHPVRVPGSPTRMIFLARRESSLRFIENSAAVEAVLSTSGVEVVYPEELAPAAQISLFATARVVLGVHGAAFTNLLFCGPGCRVVEIFPPPQHGYLAFHYIMIAKMQGMSYQAIIGSKGSRPMSGGFYLDPEKLRSVLNEVA